MKKKKNFFIILSILLSILLLLILIYKFVINKKDISDYKNSVVKIISYDENYNAISSGSGVAAISNDIILTNAHVINEAKTIEIFTNDKIPLKVSGIQYINKDSDVAIIKLLEKHNLKLLKVEEKASTGDQVYAIGYSLGILNAISDGIISSEENMDNYGNVYSHTAPISGGNSGGALINKRGNLIGINFASYDAGQNMNLAIKIENFENQYKKTKDNTPIKFDIVSLSSTGFFNTDNGQKILGEISGTSFDNLTYYVDQVSDRSNFATHNYRITGLNNPKDNKISKLVNLIVFEIDNINDSTYNKFKEFVKYHINYVNDNVKEVSTENYWNCDNKYCYLLEYYGLPEYQKIINLINNDISNEKKGNYDERHSEYVISESKIIQEAKPAVDSYVENVINGKSISKSTNDRFEVGKDIQEGKYDITVNGYADYQIFIGAVVVKLNNNREDIYMEPYSKTNCYYEEKNCDLTRNPEYFKSIKGITLKKGDILYVSYPSDSYNSQSAYLSFTAVAEQIEHDAQPAIAEIRSAEIKIFESIKKNGNDEKCYINNFLVNKCEVLFDYDKIIESFN